ELIARTDFFRDFAPGDIEFLATWVKAYKAPVGAYIFKEGSTAASLCFLVEGDISIFKETTPNEHLKIADISSGGTIGEMGIVDGNPLSASAIAASESVVLLMSRTDFEDLVHDRCALGVKLLWKISQIISLRLRQTTGLLAEISITQASFFKTEQRPK
ncbi:MAG: cyclic nucleotide-binding domain-containing protein, partial [Gammaproteobacteria bacterium]|nr:cyclic nucleotide-binding domain-containing protein [Gammaproteobacteria bacterium]